MTVGELIKQLIDVAEEHGLYHKVYQPNLRLEGGLISYDSIRTVEYSDDLPMSNKPHDIDFGVIIKPW